MEEKHKLLNLRATVTGKQKNTNTILQQHNKPIIRTVILIVINIIIIINIYCWNYVRSYVIIIFSVKLPRTSELISL